MLRKKDTYTLYELLIDTNEKALLYEYIMEEGNDGAVKTTTNPKDIKDLDVSILMEEYKNRNIAEYKAALEEKDIVKQQLTELSDSPKLNHYNIFVQDVIAYFKKWFRAKGIDPPTNTDTEPVTSDEIKDTNDALWSIADDMRQKKEEGEFEHYMDAYRWAEKYMTQNGRPIKAKRLESAYHKAKSGGIVD